MKSLGFAAMSAMFCASALGQYLAFDAGSGASTIARGSNWRGQALVLDAPTPSLTLVGLDAGVLQSPGQPALLPGQWRIHVKLWGSYDSAASPVFGSLLSDQYCVSQFSASGGLWGYLAAGKGWMLPQRVTVPTSGPIGISYQFEVLNQGVWAPSNAATVWVNDGTFAASPPARGNSAMPNGRGWYGSSTGNFTPGNYSTQSGNSNYQGLIFRLWTMCTGDLNFDLIVDDSDFVSFANAYNLLDCTDPSMPTGCPSDLNNDGFVDDQDFVVFATAYDALMCS